jgi:hypothetical protein
MCAAVIREMCVLSAAIEMLYMNDEIHEALGPEDSQELCHVLVSGAGLQRKYAKCKIELHYELLVVECSQSLFIKSLVWHPVCRTKEGGIFMNLQI